MDELLKSLTQFGLSGLFFVMWYIERKEKSNFQLLSQKAVDMSDTLMVIVKENTEAFTRLTTIIEGASHEKKNSVG